MSRIGNISSMYRQYSNYQTINTMASKLQQSGMLSPTWGSRAPTGVNQASGGLSAGSLAFVKQYQGDMTKLMDAANDLRSTGSGDVALVSGSSTVADVSASGRLTEAASYQLDVSQLAAAQQNQSAAVDATGADLGRSLDLVTGNGSFSFQASDSAATNLDVMKDLASQINRAKTGVTASVTQKDGKATLALTSDKTGESGAFLAVGGLATSTTQQAQNAVYSVSKNGGLAVKRTSETNDAYLDGGFRINAKLKSTGSTTIQTVADTTKDEKAIQNMVDSYNDSLALLNDNADRGTGVLTQMKRMLIATGNDKAMAQVGITAKKDGTLSFDKAAFRKNMAQSPSLTRDVLSGSFGLANNLYTAASQGLRQSSNSLLSQDLKISKLNQAYNPIGMMSSYSRNGAYAMGNYQMSGALLNMLV